MKKIDLLKAHKDCLDYLLAYQSEHNGFYFVPRRKNNAKKLESGMYFLCGDKYMMVSFWDGEDSTEKIHNIHFGVLDTGIAYIGLSSRDNDDRADYLEKLVSILETKVEYKFDQVKNGKWNHFYPKEMDYIDALEAFIENEKPMIDEFIKANPKSGIKMLSEAFDDKHVKTLFAKLGVDYKKFKEKKTGSAKVTKLDYIMSLQHNKLSNEMVKYLKSNGYKDVVAEEGFVDIKCKDQNGKKIFFELKTSTSVKYAIREALGQLLEYNHYPNKNKADKLIIVTTTKITKKDDLQYLTLLRTIYNIPVWYQWFDLDNKVLSQEY